MKRLPDGTERWVYPFHVCMEGMESRIICRDDEDYDTMVKTIAVSAYRRNVIIIIYAVVSNHMHAAILTAGYNEAIAFAEEVKKIYSMRFSHKYGEKKTLIGNRFTVKLLDSDWYLRNALAYIPRNAIDNGFGVTDYPWSGFRAMFRDKKGNATGREVTKMTKREKRFFFHTDDDLSGTKWMIDDKGNLLPESFCDSAYLEQAFNGDMSFFLKAIGTVNSAEMRYKLADSGWDKQHDNEFYRTVSEITARWFGKAPGELSLEQKTRIIPYLTRSYRTTTTQLARVLNLTRQDVEKIKGK